MDQSEFLQAMLMIDESGDVEMAHMEADDLLCELLIELGYGEGVKVFDNMHKWYS